MSVPSRFVNALAFLALLAGTVLASRAAAEPKVAMQGYDPVAYFTVGAPTKGQAAHSYDWDGERYLFSTADNRERFAKQPARYAPQFPGHCAAALTRGEVVTPDPRNWIIIDGKLYLFGKAIGPKLFRKNPELVQKSESNWTRLRKSAE